MTSETETTITSDVIVKLAGTTTYSDLQWLTGAASNAFTVDSDAPLRYRVQGNLEIQGDKNEVLDLTVTVYDSVNLVYVEVQSFRRSINDLSGKRSDAAFFNFECFTPSLIASDRIELWITNVGSGDDVTLLDGGTCSVTALV